MSPQKEGPTAKVHSNEGAHKAVCAFQSSGCPVRFIHLPEVGGRVIIEARRRGRITVRGHGSGLNVWGLITIRVRVRVKDQGQDEGGGKGDLTSSDTFLSASTAARPYG